MVLGRISDIRQKKLRIKFDIRPDTGYKFKYTAGCWTPGQISGWLDIRPDPGYEKNKMLILNQDIKRKIHIDQR